jgi:hypothetical protein
MIVMARPIKETPVLYGEDAQRVLERMKHVEPWPKEKVEKMRRIYKIVRKKTRDAYPGEHFSDR